MLSNTLPVKHRATFGERSGSVVERRTPEREVGVRNLSPPCCVLEQDTLLPESTGYTQERWLHPMTEKMLNGTLNLNTNRATVKSYCLI